MAITMPHNFIMYVQKRDEATAGRNGNCTICLTSAVPQANYREQFERRTDTSDEEASAMKINSVPQSGAQMLSRMNNRHYQYRGRYLTRAMSLFEDVYSRGSSIASSIIDRIFPRE